jgi:hypothetical protein
MLRTTSRFLPRPTNVIRTARSFSITASQLAGTPSPKMEAFKKAGNRENAAPKHEMVHFPGLMSEKRSFGDFRTVLHTGLYSALLLSLHSLTVRLELPRYEKL